MKKLLLIASCFLIGFTAQAQEYPNDLGYGQKYNSSNSDAPVFTHTLADPAYRMAVGATYDNTFYALSFKFAFTPHSVGQVLISPFDANYGHYGYSFYGVRYIYRFPFNCCPVYGPLTVSYPYLFAGVGALSTSYPVNDASGVYNKNASITNLGYSIGAGYEFIFAKHIGLSAEVGYGTMSANGATASYTFTDAVAFHYYFGCGCCHKRMHTENNDQDEVKQDGQEQPNMDDQPLDVAPTPKHSKHRTRRDDDDE